MSLVSATYRINQHAPQLSQFETETHPNGLKPIFLRHLRTLRGVRGWRRLDRGGLTRRPSEVERNELSLIGTAENRTRKIAPQENASAAERYSRRQRYRTHKNAQQNNVDQQVGDVVLLVEISVLVPGDADIPVHRAQKSLRVALRKRTSRNGDDRPSALVEKRSDVLDGSDPGLRLSGVVSGIDATQMFGSQRR